MRLRIAAAAVVFAAAGAANAATVSYNATVPLQTTNYDETVSVQQFDSALGTLLSVFIEMSGSVEGNASAESLDAGPSTILLNLVAEISASTAALTDIVVTLPAANETFNASAFDGAIDFSGTSGAAFTGLTASDTDSATLTGGDMAEFIGLGLVDLVVAATGQSNASGAGNIITQFATLAAAEITVTYEYEPTTPVNPIPVPAALPLLAGGLGLLGLLGRRRRA